MTGISKGSPVAWKTRALIEAWATDDAEALQTALNEIGPDLQDVVRHLIIVTGGTVQAIASAAHWSFDEALPFIWEQLAQHESDDATARLVRAAVTAWSDGDESAKFLNASGAFEGVDPETLILHLVALAAMLSRRLCDELGQPFTQATEGIWTALGTEGQRPS